MELIQTIYSLIHGQSGLFKRQALGLSIRGETFHKQLLDVSNSPLESDQSKYFLFPKDPCHLYCMWYFFKEILKSSMPWFKRQP